MSAFNKQVLTGGLLQFRTEDNQEPFKVHSFLVKRAAPSLYDVAMTSSKKAKKGWEVICLENVDEDTFLRFMEYLYGGDYNAAVGSVVSESLDEGSNGLGVDAYVAFQHASAFSIEHPAGDKLPAGVLGRNDENWPSPSYTSTKEKKPKKNLSRFSQPELETGASKARAALFIVQPTAYKSQAFPEIEWHTISGSSNDKFDFSEVWSHVKLYIFAEQYQIDNLKALVLNKLHTTLKLTNFNLKCMNELAEILVMAYKNTSEVDGDEPLRKLLILFAAQHFGELSQPAYFQILIESQSQCIADLWRQVSQYY